MSDVSKLSREEEVKERQIDREEKTPTSKVGEAETTADQIKVYAWNRTRDPSLRKLARYPCAAIIAWCVTPLSFQ